MRCVHNSPWREPAAGSGSASRLPHRAHPLRRSTALPLPAFFHVPAMRVAIFAAAAFGAAAAGAAQVPSPEEVLGYPMGGAVTDYGGLYRYLDAVEGSERLRVSAFGETFEHRELVLLTISAPDNLARLPEIRRDTRRLADPRGLADAEAERLLARTPAGVFLNYGNDGNESAAFEAALWMAWELLSGRHDALLDELVIHLVPASNPDSHERFAAWFKATVRGPDGDPDPDAAEHHAPWGLATNNNHYQINLNRDSVWSTQPENRALVRLYREVRPVVFADHHGETDSFIGPWMAEPLHAVLTDNQRAWLVEYGEAMAAAFAEAGYPYSPWEFGQFDPGYWDTLPNFTGAVGFTLETTGGGYRGLRMERPGGGEYTLRDGIEQHLVAARSLLGLTAANRERRLRDYLAYRRGALDPEGGPGGWVISGDGDPARLDTVLGLLLRNGIEVRRTTGAAAARGARPMFPRDGAAGEAALPPGSLVIARAQPEGRLAQVLLEEEARFSREFLDRVAEHRERRADPGFRHPDIWTTADAFYDITAWSVPLTHRLPAWTVAEAAGLPPEAASEPARLADPLADPPATPGALANPDARYAFLVAGDSDHAIRAAVRLGAAGVPFRVATAAFRKDGRDFGRGALAVFAAEAPDRERLGAELAALAASGARITGVAGPLTEAGPHLGSDRFVRVEPGRVAMVRDGPVRPSAYGSAWHLFERRYRLPFTALSWGRLGAADLGRYRVLVLPDGGYPDPEADPEARRILDRLGEWTKRGGVLVAMRGASAWLAGEGVAWTRTRLRGGFAAKSAFMTDGGRPDDPDPEPAAADAAEVVPGAILRALPNPESFLAFGYPEPFPVMVWSSLAFEPDPSIAAGARFPEDPAELLGSGFAFPDSLARLAGTPYAVTERVGAGRVALFLDDPNFRLFWDGLSRLFMNAVLFGASF